MKTLKLTLLLGIVAISSLTKAKAQDYCTLQYWGKEIKIDRTFFQILNDKYKLFMIDRATHWRYYDYTDYNEIFIGIVSNLKNPSFTIIVDEANQLSYLNEYNSWPNSNASNKNKKNRTRAGWIFYEVLLPALQDFANYRH